MPQFTPRFHSGLEQAAAHGHRDVVVRTDSKFVVDGATKWSGKWAENGNKTYSGKPVANQDLWGRMSRFCLDFPDV